MNAADVIALLDLKPHPEGGYYSETFRDDAMATAGQTERSNRAASTAIYFLLEGGCQNRWHRVDAAEVWHHYAGAPLALEFSTEAGAIERIVLGVDLAKGQRPQVVIPAHAWQRAICLGSWTLTGCTVAPGFEFSSFEIADGDTPPTNG